MSVKTRYEVREILKVKGFADFVQVAHYDELEDEAARRAYASAALRARETIGKERTFASTTGEPVSGLVSRVVVELFECKTDGSRTWNGKVVGADKFASEGMRLVLETAAKEETPAPTEVSTDPTELGER